MSLDNPQNAEEYLLSAFAYVHGGGSLSDTVATVREALDRHSHELAEQIRTGAEKWRDPDQVGPITVDCDMRYWGYRYAADMIDPEVQR